MRLAGARLLVAATMLWMLVAAAAVPQGRTLVVGSEQDYPPFAIGMTNETADGFTVELWKAVAQESGLAYEIRVQPFNEVLQGFKSGAVDVLINLAQSDERRQFADFSVTHVAVGGAIFVREGDDRIRAESDLAGKSVIVLRGDLADDYAVGKGWQARLTRVDTAEQGLRLLASGEHDAMLLSKLTGSQTLRNQHLSGVRALDVEVGFSQRFAFAVHKGNAELLARINEGLALTKTNGVYDRLYEKWFGVYDVRPRTWRDYLPILAGAAVAMLLGWLIMYARRRQRDRLAEARLRDSEERWKFALEGAGDGVWDANLVSRSTAYSRRWKQILGYEEHEVSSDPDEWSQRIHPDDRERVLADNQRCIDGGVDGFTSEFRMRAKDGRWIWVLDRGKVVSRGSDGRALRMIGTHTDISDRKRSEHALRDSEERLQRALEASRLALWDLDLTTGDVFLSDEWSEMLGGPRVPTRTTFEALTALVPEDDRGKIALAMGEALRGVTSGYLVEHRVNRPDGQAFWVRSQGRVVERDANGRVRRAVGTNRDITERQLARATQLHLEARLREAQKLEAIGTLAGGIAHDFNNIMAAILGNVALARQDVAPDHPAQRYLEQINKAGQRARSLVEQILAFSRKQPGEFGSHSLRPIVEETIAMLRSMISKDTTLRQNLTEQALRVNCNPTQLQQVLLNLGNNAWQALPAGKGLIEIGLDETVFATGEVRMPSGLEPGAYAHLWVRDEGSGMDEETRLHIFEPFFTTKLVGKGTGLGLAVVHGIVESHGGAVDVSTALGKGSTFHVYLPVVDDESAAMPLAAQDPAGTSEGHGQRVLYLDDDEVMTVMVHSLLQRLGYRATCMLDAREALALVERDPDGFDLVVTDFNMPGLSGLDVARRLAEVRPGLPVVISSGYISDALRTESVELGVRAVMRKEHTFEELGAVVRSSLSAFDRAGPPHKVS